jgi:lipopolysaccharide/colanic/teichoic acid biosynthesis glycosyltransferase
MTETTSAVGRREAPAAPAGSLGEAGAAWDSVLPAWAGTRRWRVALAVKRAVDIVGGTLGLILAAPVMALAAALIKLGSRGPILHRMEWVGWRGRQFAGYKLRTMVADAERQRAGLRHLNEMTGPVFKIANDPRVTRLGRLLRRSSIDELPQLWSVLRGDLSLVGPRAPRVEEYVAFEPRQRLKLAVKPGITCLWQVSGRAEIRDFDEWIRLDLDYIRRWSLWLDLKLLARTVPAVLSGRGAA